MKRGKVLIFTIMTFFLVLLGSFAAEAANFSEQKAYDWLVSKASSDGSYNSQAFDTALAILALNALGDSVSEEKAMAWLESKKNVGQACWPTSNCKIKDTAMTLIALNAVGSDLKSDTEDWLENGQSPGMKTGNWLIEISTGATGSCKFTFNLNSIVKEKIVKVANGYFPECGNTTFLDVNNCLGVSGLTSSNAGILLTIDCSALGTAPIITLLYREGNSFYLLETINSATGDLRINNGCYGKSFKASACEVEPGLYANWALEEAKSESNTVLYLKENIDDSNVVHNALLSLITSNKKYANALKSLQRTDGSWNKNAYDTSLAIYALSKDGTFATEVQNGITWMQSHQKADGSFDSDVKSTAMAIYAVFPQANVEVIQGDVAPSCTDGRKNQDERGIDCGGTCENSTGDDCCNNDVQDEGEDGVDCGGACGECEGEPSSECNSDSYCDFYDGENIENCPGDCEPDLCTNDQQDKENYEEGIDCGGACGIKCADTETCDDDKVCDDDEGENAQNCPADCCGDGECDDVYENSVTCPADCKDSTEIETEETECKVDGDCAEGEMCTEGACVAPPEEEGGSYTWLIVAVIIVVLGVGGFFFYKKFLSPPKKKDSEMEGFGEEEGGIFGGLPPKPK